MKYSVSPVVKVAVKVKDGKDLPKLVEGLKKLSKSDPLVVCTTEANGEHVIAGCGELHVEICLKDLKEEYAQCEFTVSEPVVSYRETVAGESSATALAKSPNKHNRLYVVAEPMPEELSVLIESGKAGPKADPKERARLLKDQFEWDDASARKIWAWGPETEGANLVVDQTTAVQYLLEIKEHVNSAFQWCTKEGPLCEENMRGIMFKLMDVTMHADSIHRGAGQIMPPTRRACFAAEMMATPTLQEPVFLVEITCPQDAMSGVYNVMNMRRGCVFEENQREGTPLMQVKAYLPVSESFGFVSALRAQTSGQAFPQCVFDHWDTMQGNAMEEGKMQDLVLAVRKRKNLKHEMPKLVDYLDKL
jgi:elongation factor 2